MEGLPTLFNKLFQWDWKFVALMVMEIICLALKVEIKY